MVNGAQVSADSLEELVKKNLEIIILAMLQEKSMCGYDIIKKIYEDYNILMSQGAVYPLLYTLKEGGILQVEYARGSTRAKIYSPTETGKVFIKKKLDEFINASDYLIQYIRRE